MFVFGTTTDYDPIENAIESHPLHLSWVWLVLMLMLGYGVAILLACVVFRLTYGWVLRPAIATHLRERTCLSCGYSLLGLTPSRARIRCPECGEDNETRLLGIASTEQASG